jgi:hypothetical protein
MFYRRARNVLEARKKFSTGEQEMFYNRTRNILQARKKCSTGVQEMFYKCARNVLQVRMKCYTCSFPTFLTIIQINVLCIGFALNALYIKDNMTDHVRIK